MIVNNVSEVKLANLACPQCGARITKGTPILLDYTPAGVQWKHAFPCASPPAGIVLVEEEMT